VQPSADAEMRAAAAALGVEVHELQIGLARPDIGKQPLRSRVLATLGLPPSAQLERLKGSQGGKNEGVWRVRSGSTEFILKLVPSVHPLDGPGAVMPCEVDKLLKLGRNRQELVKDADVAFPLKILRLSVNHRVMHELIVMRYKPGQRLAEVIASKWPNQAPLLMGILREFGIFLARFHSRYGGLQHNDCQQSNVLYDEKTGDFTLLDISDMGPRSALTELDTDRFVGGLKLLSNYYGQHFFVEAKRSFEDGYHASLRRVRRGGA